MTKEEIQALAKTCMFQFDDSEIEYVNESFDVLYHQIELLSQIDTSNVEAMVYPFEEPITYLRVDTHSRELSKEDVLKNAMEKDDNYIKVVTKVVK